MRPIKRSIICNLFFETFFDFCLRIFDAIFSFYSWKYNPFRRAYDSWRIKYDEWWKCSKENRQLKKHFRGHSISFWWCQCWQQAKLRSIFSSSCISFRFRQIFIGMSFDSDIYLMGILSVIREHIDDRPESMNELLKSYRCNASLRSLSLCLADIDIRRRRRKRNKKWNDIFCIRSYSKLLLLFTCLTFIAFDTKNRNGKLRREAKKEEVKMLEKI